MSKKNNHTTPSKGNVFRDLGFLPDEAERLKLASLQKILDEKIALIMRDNPDLSYEFVKQVLVAKSESEANKLKHYQFE